MSNIINGSWKKNLQSFLKGQGKLNPNSFQDKAIILKLQGGKVEVVDPFAVDDFFKKHKLQPNLTYKIIISETPDGGIKSYVKETTTDQANLFVVSPQQNQETRNKMFDIKHMECIFISNRQVFDSKIAQLRRHILNSGNQKNKLKLAIADKLCKKCPFIYVQLFMTKYCEQQDEFCKLISSNTSQNSGEGPNTIETMELFQMLYEFLKDIANTPLNQKCQKLNEMTDLNHEVIYNIMEYLKNNEDSKDIFWFYTMILQEQGEIIDKPCDVHCQQICNIFTEYLIEKVSN